MDIKQVYYDFLKEQGAKEKVTKIIRDGIENWKKEPAYEYKPFVDPYTKDISGMVNRIGDKTIGDICNTDEEVLKAYSGRSKATYTSHCGLFYLKVADDITDDLNTFFSHIFYEFCRQYDKDLVEELCLDCPLPLTDDDITEVVWDAVEILTGDSLSYVWMEDSFPEYVFDDENGEPSLIFLVHD